MIAVLSQVLSQVVAVSSSSPPPSVSAIEPYALAVSALAFIYIRARVRSQVSGWDPRLFVQSRECVTDAVLACALAFVWPVQIALEVPAVGQVSWPPFQFPATAGLAQRAVLVGLGAFLFIDVLKIVLFRWPAMFAKYAGVTAPNGNGEGKEPPK